MKKWFTFIALIIAFVSINLLTLIPKPAQAQVISCYGSSIEVCAVYTEPNGCVCGCDGCYCYRLYPYYSEAVWPE